MIIITGSGRSGTKWMSALFGTEHEWSAKEFERELWPKFLNRFDDPEDRENAMRWHLRNCNIDSFADCSNMYVHFLDALYSIDQKIKILLVFAGLIGKKGVELSKWKSNGSKKYAFSNCCYLRDKKEALSFRSQCFLGIRRDDYAVEPNREN